MVSQTVEPDMGGREDTSSRLPNTREVLEGCLLGLGACLQLQLGDQLLAWGHRVPSLCCFAGRCGRRTVSTRRWRTWPWYDDLTVLRAAWCYRRYNASHAPPPPPCSPSRLSPAACAPPPHQMYPFMAFSSLPAAISNSSPSSCCLTHLATNIIMATPAFTCLVKENHYHYLPCTHYRLWQLSDII